MVLYFCKRKNINPKFFLPNLMHKLFLSYLLLFTFIFCFVSIAKHSLKISFDWNNTCVGEFCIQYSDLLSELNEEENENEIYSFPLSNHYTISSFESLNNGFKKIDSNFINLHYEVNSEPPEFKSLIELYFYS